jgi:hypothetical protein
LTPPGFVNRLRVGETTLAVRAARRSWISWPGAFVPFLASRGQDIDIAVRREAGPPPGDLLFESEGVWQAYEQPDERLLLTFRVGTRIYKSVLLDQAITEGELFFPYPPQGHGSRSAMVFPLDEMLFQRRWAKDGLLEVHGCGVRDRNGVLLFAGQSGAGKSTTARLWNHFQPDRTILSDDRVLLDPRRNGPIRAWGTPWHGMGRFASNSRGDLRALFFLEQARVSEAVAIHPAEAAARLFTRTFPAIWDREVTARGMEACALVAERVPAFILRFRRDETAISEARRAASATGPSRPVRAPTSL